MLNGCSVARSAASLDADGDAEAVLLDASSSTTSAVISGAAGDSSTGLVTSTAALAASAASSTAAATSVSGEELFAEWSSTLSSTEEGSDASAFSAIAN